MKHRSIIAGILTMATLSSCSSGQRMDHSMMRHDRMMGGSDDVPETVLTQNNIDLNTLPEAKPSTILEVKNGDTIDLNPGIVKKTIDGTSFAFYAYNGQFPGPTIRVKQGSTFTVRVKNDIDQETTVHWHGIRLDNPNDGVPGVTQNAIKPGDTFTYTVKVPDEGIFWYHPHVREDIQQDMGLYGLLHVTPRSSDAYPAVDKEEYIVLDDILLQKGMPVPHGKRSANFALMGRFGNTFLINGNAEPPSLEVKTNTSVRYYLLNAANTRTFNVSFSEAKAKLVGGDAGRYETPQELKKKLIISPSERYIVDVLYWDARRANGVYHINPTPIENDSGVGSRMQTLLDVVVSPTANDAPTANEFQAMEAHDDVIADINNFRTYFDTPVDHTLRLTVEMAMDHGMMMHHGTESDGIEWEDTMPMMNAMATDANTQWKLIDEATGKENMDINYVFQKGDKVKIRIINDADSAHPMQHPIHFHGQRFLVLSMNGVQEKNLVWKDTVLIPKGATADILLDASNPGEWMIHCHIAEHLTNGMMGGFTVR
ncbi:multicopper oxidase family protein [Candidatus Peregrinibacteria bacterium]|nr:multicopper oxidase family protein [Candidatus Peregrinibacteria bacterium]